MFNDCIHNWFIRATTSDYCIGVVIFLLLIVIFRIFFRKCRIVVSDSKLGRIRMSNHALCTVIYGVCKESDGIAHPRVKLRMKHGKIVVDISVKLSTCKDVRALTGDLQSKLRDVLTNSLGIDCIGRINVIVSGFSCCDQGNRFVAERCCINKQTDQAQNE